MVDTNNQHTMERAILITVVSETGDSLPSGHYLCTESLARCVGVLHEWHQLFALQITCADSCLPNGNDPDLCDPNAPLVETLARCVPDPFNSWEGISSTVLQNVHIVLVTTLTRIP